MLPIADGAAAPPADRLTQTPGSGPFTDGETARIRDLVDGLPTDVGDLRPRVVRGASNPMTDSVYDHDDRTILSSDECLALNADSQRAVFTLEAGHQLHQENPELAEEFLRSGWESRKMRRSSRFVGNTRGARATRRPRGALPMAAGHPGGMASGRSCGPSPVALEA